MISVAILWAGVLSVAPAGAQKFRGTITGRVTDTSDAIIAGVTIHAVNIEINEIRNSVDRHA